MKFIINDDPENRYYNVQLPHPTELRTTILKVEYEENNKLGVLNLITEFIEKFQTIHFLTRRRV